MNVTILGGGMSGFMAAAAFMEDHAVTIIEPETPGGAFLQGGFKYFHAANGLPELLMELEIPYHTYPIRGGILLGGKVRHYPDHLRELPRTQAADIMRTHFEKTRGRSGWSNSAMNDPFGPKPDKLIASPTDIIKKVLGKIECYKDRASSIKENVVQCYTGAEIPYDLLINTLPMWFFPSMIETPIEGLLELTESAKANRLSIFRCLSRTNEYTDFDYVYTPETPGDMIHRLSVNNTWFELETAKPLTYMQSLMDDIKSLLGEVLVIGASTIPGHLLGPLPMKRIQELMPDNWLMVGRFAAWDSRCTVDKAYATALNWKGANGF